MNIDWLFRGSGFVLGMIGLWLIYWLLLGDRAKGRKRCPKCWYDMPSADSLRCSECGNDAKGESDLLKTRRRWNGLWLCLLVFLGAGYLWIQPRVKQDGWVSVMPTTALILCIRLDDNQAFIAELENRTQVNVKEYYPELQGSSFLVNNPESLHRWQWRLIGDTCIDLMNDNPDILDRQLLFEWLYRSSWGVSEDDADRYFQATVSFLTNDDPVIRGRAALFTGDLQFALRPHREFLRKHADSDDENVRRAARYYSGLTPDATDFNWGRRGSP